VHMAAEVWAVGGVSTYLYSRSAPTRRTLRVCTAILVGLAGVGGCLLAGGWSPGRGLLASSALLVIPHSRYFASMATLLSLSVAACMPFLATMLVIMMLFAQAFHELYVDTPTEDGPFFSSFGQSLRTMFRLFTGESWHAIMYDIAYETNDSAKFLFMAYVFASTLLFGQLVLGIIISVYDEIVTFTTTTIYSTLVPLYGHLNTKERSRIISDFMTINCLLMDVHARIEELSSTEASSVGRWFLVLKHQLVDAVEDVAEELEEIAEDFGASRPPSRSAAAEADGEVGQGALHRDASPSRVLERAEAKLDQFDEAIRSLPELRTSMVDSAADDDEPQQPLGSPLWRAVECSKAPLDGETLVEEFPKDAPIQVEEFSPEAKPTSRPPDAKVKSPRGVKSLRQGKPPDATSPKSPKSPKSPRIPWT